MSPKTWKTLSSKIVYETPWLKVRHNEVIRPDGRRGIYGYLDKKPGVAVLVQEKDTFLLEKNYRYPSRKTFWEIPVGCTETDNFSQEAVRELYEETGLKVNPEKLQPFGKVYLGVGHENTFLHVFYLQVDHFQPNDRHQAGDEAIRLLKKVKIKKVLQMLRIGQLQDSVLVFALAVWLTRQNNQTNTLP